MWLWYLFLVDEESGSEEETLQYFSTLDPNYRSRRKKKLDSQNKHSQSFLSVLLSINHGLVAVFTDVKVRIYGAKVVSRVQLMVNLPRYHAQWWRECGAVSGTVGGSSVFWGPSWRQTASLGTYLSLQIKRHAWHTPSFGNHVPVLPLRG